MDDLYGRLGLRRKPQVYNRGVKRGMWLCLLCHPVLVAFIFPARVGMRKVDVGRSMEISVLSQEIAQATSLHCLEKLQIAF